MLTFVPINSLVPLRGTHSGNQGSGCPVGRQAHHHLAKQIVPFQFEANTINIIKDDAGNPWWVAKEVCEVLGFPSASDALRGLDVDEKQVVRISTHNMRGNPNTNIINEPGLYSLILRSRKPAARRFKRWVTHEVLPSIRKDGGYLHATPEMTDEEIMARAVLLGQKKIEALQGQIRELAPKAEAFDNVISLNGMTTCSSLAGSSVCDPTRPPGAALHCHHVHLRSQKVCLLLDLVDHRGALLLPQVAQMFHHYPLLQTPHR